MTEALRCVSPVDGSIYVERDLADGAAASQAVARARRAQSEWRHMPMAERQARLSKAVDAFVAKGAEIAQEIAWQMGRPLGQCPGEIAGFEERARHMIAIAPDALADVAAAPKDGFTRFVRRDPLGLVFVMAPWNYPYLTAVNAIVPALMAGNAVILKHSAQTPLCAERFAEAFAAGGLPDGLFQPLHLGHRTALDLVGHAGVDFVAFTGSVPAGHAVQDSRGQALHRHGPGAGRQGPGLCPGRREARARGRPTWSTAPSSTPASRAAASSGSTCTRRSMTPSSKARWR